MNDKNSKTLYNADKKGLSVQAIDEAKFIEIGGVKQFIMIRGLDSTNPILLLLHGGTSESAHFAKFNAALKEDFTLVYWDQRGEGRSRFKDTDRSLLTLNRYLEDTHELTHYLKKRFKQEKIYLLAHSMGTLFGMKIVERYPKDYQAYIAISQVADPIKSDNIAYDQLEKKGAKELHAIPRVTKENLDSIDFTKRTNRLISLSIKHGGLYHKSGILAMLRVSLFPILTFKPYSLRDKFNATRQHEERILLYYKHALNQSITKIEIPIYFIHGKDDYIINYALSKAYYQTLQAPKKEFITFKKSAHFPPFEEPEKFNTLVKKIKKETDGI